VQWGRSSTLSRLENILRPKEYAGGWESEQMPSRGGKIPAIDAVRIPAP